VSDDDITARIRPTITRRPAMGSIVNILLNGFADTLEKVAVGSSQPAVLLGTAALLRAVVRVLEDRTPEEALAILEWVRDHGTVPITAGELDAQVKATLDKAQAKP
jgi:hypothetical protein